MKAYFLSLNPEANALDQWDAGFLLDFLNGNVWQPPSFTEFEIIDVNKLPKDDKAIVIIPARHHADLVDEVNHHLNRINKVVLFLMGDEEHDFPIEKIKHPDIHIWVQNPEPGRHDDYNKLGTGYPPQLKKNIPTKLDKTIDIFFAGQITHKRRTEMLNNLNEWDAQGNSSDVVTTRGFTQGLSHEDYYRRMSQAKIAPAPSGAVIPDSFRAYEALECMCVLMADERDPHDKIDGYWDWLFDDDCPFYKIKEWDNLVGRAYEALEQWPTNLHTQTAWWIAKKREFAYTVLEQLNV